MDAHRIITNYLGLVKACDNFPSNKDAKHHYYELYLPDDDHPHGYLLPDIVRRMPWTASFRITHTAPRSVVVLDSSDGQDVAAAVNRAFAELVTICIDRDLFHVLDRRHSEPFAILGAKLPVSIERFASSLFGIASCGAHMIAYVNSTPSPVLWVARRAAHLYSYPGYLDTTVAGGVRAGASPLEVIVEEANEEASFPSDFVRSAVRARGVITYMGITGDDWPGEKGLVLPDVLYVYDLELPAHLSPKPHDEEVHDFQCMTVAEVQDRLLSKQFKPDAAAVFVDFFIRHGILTAQNENDYVEILTHLHRRLPFPINPRRR